ncbi:AraC family transcriptional regulator [Nonomuraea turkmeniaca]|uniref:AraC family transcriptional regulator n=1 Tax=Nonomuraea turkmeniaca TaxID=103838 RepID=A0A5S4EUC6_9ACTN|nr:AraC family transcriptional regulator [Nonomuraea turkmeniaca]TMR03804.1 AraC family transcriptional regulator [Nonomuraea turkmeniaca]
MDQLAALLDGPRARGAFLLRVILDSPWSLRIQDEAPLAITAVVRGEAWVVPDAGEPVRVRPGQVVINRGPEPYTIADHPGAEPQIIIHPGGHCRTLDGQSLYQAMDLGVRTWGNNPDGDTVMLTGAYTMEGEVSRRLLEALPSMIVQPGGPIISLLGAEIVKDEPGQDAVLDRLLDLLLIAVLRSWFATHEAPAWYRAMGDPVVGKAMRMLHNNPAHPWTVAALAAEVGVSRASLARRFTELVGEPPMSFLTDWRLALAADLLREPDATIGSVARKVGYGSPFALSAAFKRVRGVSPQEYRERDATTSGRSG